MPRRFLQLSKARVSILLLLFSCVAIVVPAQLTGRMSSLLQVLVPVQHIMSYLTARGEGSVERISADESDRLRRELQAYEHRLLVMGSRVADLQQRNGELSKLRNRGFESGRLIRARIVAADSLPWRESRLLDRGTLAGVGRGDAVVSRFWLKVGSEDEVVDGMSILAGETLVGEVFEVSTHTSRVLLLSDPQCPPRLVRIGRETSSGFAFVEAEFLIHGTGHHQMEIRGVGHRYVEGQKIQVGDTVLTSGEDRSSPIPLVIGRIVGIRRDDDNGVLYHLSVQPSNDVTKLQRVYVVDASPS